MPGNIIFHWIFLTYCQAMRLFQFTLCRSNWCNCLFLETYDSMHKANTRIQSLKLPYQNASAREFEHKAHIPDIQLSEFTSPLRTFSKDRSGAMFLKVVCSSSLDLLLLLTTCGHCKWYYLEIDNVRNAWSRSVELTLTCGLCRPYLGCWSSSMDNRIHSWTAWLY